MEKNKPEIEDNTRELSLLFVGKGLFQWPSKTDMLERLPWQLCAEWLGRQKLAGRGVVQGCGSVQVRHNSAHWNVDASDGKKTRRFDMCINKSCVWLQLSIPSKNHIPKMGWCGNCSQNLNFPWIYGCLFLLYPFYFVYF